MAVQRNTSGARTARGAGTGANGPSGGPSQNNRSGKPRKRRISKKQQAIYRRRRIGAGTVLLLIIALIVFCVYSLGRGIGAVNSMIHHDEVYAISRDATPAPKKVSNVKDCSASDVTLQLSAASQSVPVGGSLDFTATIVHEGSGNCLVMAKGDKDVQKVTWNTNANATLAKCTDESGWAKVNAGTYVAQLSLKDHPKVKSDPVTFTVQ